MFDKVAVVGEADIIFALRALGVKVFSPKSLEEAKERISFLDRYPMDWGLDKLGERLQHMNIERLYRFFAEEQSR